MWHVWGRGTYKVMVGKPDGKRPLGRDRHRWEDTIKIDLQEIGWGDGLDRSDSGWGQVVGSCVCGNEPLVSMKCGDFLD